MSITDTTVVANPVSEHGEQLEQIACPLCDGTESDLVYEAKDLLYGQPGTYPVVRCRACGLVYVNPRPVPAALGRHYPDDYHCYVPMDESPAAIRPMMLAIARGATMRRVKMIEEVIGRITPETRIVDVGCGLNELLYHIKQERGAVGTGVDMKGTMVARIRDKLQMPVVHGTFENSGLEAGHYDLVTMIEYLEHEPHPRTVLTEARRVLKTGGHLALEIPDPSGWPARAFKSRWANLDVPRHLVFFDPTTVNRALSEHGFELVSEKRFGMPLYTGISVLFWLGRHNAMRNTFTTPLLSGILGAPFLPVLPWMKEFLFVVAKAV